MSFALTEQQIRDGTKTVTRRLGWKRLNDGDLIRPVRKCMGLKPGQKIEPIRGPMRVRRVNQEPLNRLIQNAAYGLSEVAKEGFADMTPAEFVAFFCKSHRPCEPSWIVTRIEFEYLPDEVAL